MKSKETKRKKKMEKTRDLIRLNVGGKLFVTSRETLSQCAFFEGLFRFEPDSDQTYFIDRNPKVFATILELLRTGVLFWETDTQLRAVLIEADFFLLRDMFRKALCPIRDGLYTVGRDQQGAGDSHPWIVFVETSFNREKFRPCQVLLTGVVDEEVLLRCQASFGVGGFVNVEVRGRTLSLYARGEGEVHCTWDGGRDVGDKTLTLQSEPESLFPEEEIQLKAKLSRTKSKGRKISMWFEAVKETGEILLWKQKSDGRTYSNTVTILCKSLFIFSNQRTPLGLIFLSGRVPFLIKRRDAQEVEDNIVTVIALERERKPRIANIDGN